MRVATWNVNGLRAVERKGALQPFLDVYAPDLLLLQEIKGRATQFSDALTAHPDYVQYYHSAAKPGYAGTGVWIGRALANTCARLVFRTDVPHVAAADEGRVSCLEMERAGEIWNVLAIYFPNGGKSDVAWQDKLLFYDEIRDYMNALHDAGHIVVMGGDLNVAHRPIDLARPRENDGKIGFHPEERLRMDRYLEDGWIDLWRAAYPDTVSYTWWDQKSGARMRDIGWRIDYLMMHCDESARVQSTAILGDVMGSDHCPVMMEVL